MHGHHHIHVGVSITNLHREREREKGYIITHVYAIYESMHMQQYATIEAHIGRMLCKSQIGLALGVAQHLQQQDFTVYNLKAIVQKCVSSYTWVEEGGR